MIVIGVNISKMTKNWAKNGYFERISLNLFVFLYFYTFLHV
jgi:hypothetical protein